MAGANDLVTSCTFLQADELSKEKRHELVSQFSRNAAASKSALDAMAKALAQSENERRRANQVRSCFIFWFISYKLVSLIYLFFYRTTVPVKHN